ncbi:MAG: pre-peptidase C-terminal domain-containing protein, partial [Vallitaleaceae bacterium]|nr:pre-peptidase C-terminal domain-containing protein [Vallitaleaceae bacterium]
ELALGLQTGENGDFDKAYPITFGTKLYSYVKTKDTYNAWNYEDYFSFEVKSAHAVTINTVAKDFSNVKLALYSATKEGSPIYSDSSDNKTNRFISGVLQPGKYVIKVSGSEGAYYGLLLESLEAAALSSKKVAATVRPDIKIVINGEAFTAKDANGNVIYPVIINGSTYLPVRSVAQAVGLNIGWDGSIRTVIMAKNPTDNLLQNVGNKFTNAGSINEIEDNDEFYSAQEIALVGSVNAEIYDDQSGTTDKMDYYKIDVPYEGRLTVQVEGTSEIGDLNLNLSGYNNNNSPIIYDQEGDSTSRIVQPYLKAGSYIIKVSGAEANGAYSLTTNFECPTTQGENNDDFSTATVIDLQSEVDGIILSRDSLSDKDYDDFYRIVVFDVGTIQIKVTSDRTVNAGVYLYSSLKTNSPIVTNTTAVESERTISQAVQPGVYYIKVVHNGDPGMYHLSTSFTK